MSAEDMDDFKEFPTRESALDWLDNYLSLDERNNLIRALQQEPCNKQRYIVKGINNDEIEFVDKYSVRAFNRYVEFIKNEALIENDLEQDKQMKAGAKELYKAVQELPSQQPDIEAIGDGGDGNDPTVSNFQNILNNQINKRTWGFDR